MPRAARSVRPRRPRLRAARCRGAVFTIVMTQFAIAETARAGPFGVDPGGEMPRNEFRHTYEGPATSVRREAVPWGFETMRFWGTGNIGICRFALNTRRVSESGAMKRIAEIQPRLIDKYGLPEVNDDGTSYVWRPDYSGADNDIEEVNLFYYSREGFDSSLSLFYTFTNYDECWKDARLHSPLLNPPWWRRWLFDALAWLF